MRNQNGGSKPINVESRACDRRVSKKRPVVDGDCMRSAVRIFGDETYIDFTRNLQNEVGQKTANRQYRTTKFTGCSAKIFVYNSGNISHNLHIKRTKEKNAEIKNRLHATFIHQMTVKKER